MAVVTIHSLSEEAPRALEARAAQHGRIVEAEVREILEATVRFNMNLHIGPAIVGLSRRAGLINADVGMIEKLHEYGSAIEQHIEMLLG